MNNLASVRLTDLRRFYALMDDLAQGLGGLRTLADCSGRMVWPLRGIYFFQEHGEVRRESGTGPRIVRVGTHALKDGSQTTLWQRLSQHKGQKKLGGGNHRGSIFRLLVGAALMDRDAESCGTWGRGSSAPSEIRHDERNMERRVSAVIGQMPFLWLRIDDEPGPQSLRGFIERNAIALLSNASTPTLDPPSQNWLGRYCPRERVRHSGLWNQNHVNEAYDSSFLDVLQEVIKARKMLA